MREDVQCGKITDVIQPNPVNHRTTLLYTGDERAELENQREHKYSYPSVCTQCTLFYRQQNLRIRLAPALCSSCCEMLKTIIT